MGTRGSKFRLTAKNQALGLGHLDVQEMIHLRQRYLSLWPLVVEAWHQTKPTAILTPPVIFRIV